MYEKRKKAENMKNKYDTSVVFLYATGNENLLPANFRKQIPYTTISSWRKTDYSKYIGCEFRSYFTDNFDLLKFKTQNEQLRKTLFALARSWVVLSTELIPTLLKAKKDKKLQSKVLNAIHYLRNYLGMTKTLKMLGITRALYEQWIIENRYSCFDSFQALCVKRHPHQLQLTEIKKMYKALNAQEYKHWPIISIQAYFMRKKKIVASPDSWYKYSNLFGIKRKLVKKDNKKIGLIATYPNEYWHVDATYYSMANGQKACITFLMDNYSKMILGYHVSLKYGFYNVKCAIRNALKNVALHPNVNHTYLVADGGRENHNKNIDNFIARLSKHKITKVRSLKDIRFSNSPVEAINRTIKGRYLKNRKFDTLKELKEFIKWAVHDYNEIRPHYKHRPRTPQEVYFEKSLGFNERNRLKKAALIRINNNKCAKCIQCTNRCKSKNEINNKKLE